jgi:hypothetical protein
MSKLLYVCHVHELDSEFGPVLLSLCERLTYVPICLISSIHRTTLQRACQVGVLSTPVPWAFPKCEAGV